ncbi:hypothetical protein ACLOJK_026823 [Asimina triloba]
MESAASCNTIRAEPLETMTVLRSGRATPVNLGKAPAVETHTLKSVVPSAPTKPAGVEYDVLGHLKRLPAKLSIYDALQLSQEAREALINALTDENIRLS